MDALDSALTGWSLTADTSVFDELYVFVNDVSPTLGFTVEAHDALTPGEIEYITNLARESDEPGHGAQDNYFLENDNRLHFWYA